MERVGRDIDWAVECGQGKEPDADAGNLGQRGRSWRALIVCVQGMAARVKTQE
jgi:hypothetical protein